MELYIKQVYCTFSGAFAVRILQPGQQKEPLFNYDVIAKCPPAFTFSFRFPTDGADNHDKRFDVEIVDSFRTIKVKVFRPAPRIKPKPEGERVALIIIHNYIILLNIDTNYNCVMLF